MSKAKESRNRGNAAFKSGKWEDAIKYYTRAINLDGKDFLCLANRSAAHLRINNNEEALRDAERCVKIKSTYAKGHVRKAAALHAMKRFDDEFKAIREGIRICPNDDTLKQGLQQCKQQRTKSSKANQAARRTQATMRAAESRGRKQKKSKNVSQFVLETKKILELQMAAIKAQLDMISELMTMGREEKLDLLFSLMDKDGGGTIDAKELAEGLRKQNDGLSFSGSIEKSIEMIAIFDDDGDAELDRQEFEHFVGKMVEELESTLDEFAEFLVYQILFSEKGKDEEEEVDINQVNQLVKERGELLESLNDPRMKTLYELFDIDGDGAVSFKEVACGLYHLTNNMEESAKATTGLLLMLDKDDQRLLGFQQFAKLILAIAASTGITFDEVADDLTLALSSDNVMSKKVLRELTIADEEYTKVRNRARKEKQMAGIDPLAYQRCARLFEIWDADGDGTLDFDEVFDGLYKYHKAARDGKTMGDVKKAAQAMMDNDVDGDQLLDRDEFAVAMIQYGKNMGTDVHGLIDFMCVATALAGAT